MQTPAGYEVIDGVYHVTSWVEVIFNPSFPYRLAHMLLASALTCAFLLAGLSAWQLLRGVAQRSAPRVLRVGLTLAALADSGADLRRRPARPEHARTPAGEDRRDGRRVGDRTRRAAAAVRDSRRARRAATTSRSRIPKLASLILTHELDGEIKGLNDFRGAHPPPLPLFFAFRIMVGVGMLMLATSWLGWWLCRRAQWQPAALPRALLWLFAGMTFSGWVATVAGWYVTEIGRQPFIVYGLIRTADVVSDVPSAHDRR